MIIRDTRLSARAREYFGGDVQGFWIERPSPGHYELWQRPHWGSPRRVSAAFGDAREAIRKFNQDARDADRNHA